MRGLQQINYTKSMSQKALRQKEIHLKNYLRQTFKTQRRARGRKKIQSLEALLYIKDGNETENVLLGR